MRIHWFPLLLAATPIFAVSAEPSNAEDTEVSQEQTPEPVHTMDTIVVTPGTFSTARDEGGNTGYDVTQEEIRTSSWADDATRSVVGLPGISSNDYSSKFTVRGGEQDEILITLDGMELYEPFHQRDYSGGLFAIVDPLTLEGVTLNTGGFTAAEGNRVSGSLQMTTRTPETRKTSIGLSPVMASAYTEGRFADGQGAYLFSARRGMLDLVFKAAGGELDTERGGVDVLVTGEYALALGDWRMRPGLHAGAGWLRSISDNGLSATADREEVDSGGILVGLALAVSAPLTEGLAFDIRGAAEMAPLAHTSLFTEEGVTLAGNPRWYLRLSTGLCFGGR